MKRRSPWLIFALCALLLLGGLGYLTHYLLEAEAARLKAEQIAELEGPKRLALWRLDSAVLNFLAEEQLVPPEAYGVGDPNGTIAALAPPLPPEFQLRFAVSEEGEVIMAGQTGLAQSNLALGTNMNRAKGVLLNELVANGTWKDLNSIPLPLPESSQAAQLEGPGQGLANELISQKVPEQKIQTHQKISQSEFQARNRLNSTAMNRFKSWAGNPSNFVNEAGMDLSIDQGLLRGAWLKVDPAGKGELFFLRSANVRSEKWRLCIWANWNRLRDRLKEEVKDLYPNIELIADDRSDDLGGRMAVIPVRMVVPMEESPADPFTPGKRALLLTWCTALLSLGLAAFVLHRTLDLSDRRMRFVSAVTHELRSPMTTFRLYTDMLASGVVRDPERVQEYLDTLDMESGRLTRVLDNVLSYARLEDGRRVAATESTTVADLAEQVSPLLLARAGESGWKVEMSIEQVADRTVTYDRQCVEQILLNLLDNAIKYAPNSPSKTLTIKGVMSGSRPALLVSDDGPGIDVQDHRRLFAPFERGGQHEVGTIPGVGLGLPLSRGLARSFGGDLSLVQDQGPGARFCLTLGG